MNFSLARAKQARVTDVALIHRKGCSARRENHISDVSVIAFISAARDWQCRHNQFFSRAQEKIGPRCWIDLSANDGETCRDNLPPPRSLDLFWNACGYRELRPYGFDKLHVHFNRAALLDDW